MVVPLHKRIGMKGGKRVEGKHGNRMYGKYSKDEVTGVTYILQENNRHAWLVSLFIVHVRKGFFITPRIAQSVAYAGCCHAVPLR